MLYSLNTVLDFLRAPGSKLMSLFSHGSLKAVVVVQSLSRIQLFATPRTAVHQASLSFSISWSLLKLMFMMLSNHLILCRPLLLLPSVFSSIRVFSSELAFPIRWPKYWSFCISSSSEYSGSISLKIDWVDLLAVQDSRVFSSTTVQKHHFFGAQPSLWFSSHICT